MNNRLNIKRETQSAHVKMNDITMKLMKIKKTKVIARITAILFCFLSVSFRLFEGNLIYTLDLYFFSEEFK